MRVGGSPTRIKQFFDLAFQSLSNERPSQMALSRIMPGSDRVPLWCWDHSLKAVVLWTFTLVDEQYVDTCMSFHFGAI